MPRGFTSQPRRTANEVRFDRILHSSATYVLFWLLALALLWHEWITGVLMAGVPVAIFLPAVAILGVGHLYHPRLGKLNLFFPFLLASLLICGPVAALLAGFAGGLLAALMSRQGRYRWNRILLASSRATFAAWIAGRFFLLTGGQPGFPVRVADLNGLLAAMAGYLMVFSLLTVIWRIPFRKKGFLPVWRRLILKWTPGSLIGVAVAAGIGAFFEQFGWIWGLTATGVLFGLFYAGKFYIDYVLGARTREAEITRGYLSIIEALASAIEAKDRIPDNHLRRVQHIAVELAKLMELPTRRIEELRTASLLHDIGYLAVPGYILSKPGKLTAEEFDRVRIHPKVGAEILDGLDLPNTLAEIVRSHHEKFDGTGYPDELEGRQIPVGARIMAVVDSYDSLTSDRPYRKAVSKAQTIRFLRERAGRDFDPEVVNHLVKEIDRIEAGWKAKLRQSNFSVSPMFQWSNEVSRSESAREAETTRRNLLTNISTSHNEIYSLYEIVEILGKSLDLPEILTLLSKKISHLIPFQCCVLYIVDPSKQVLLPRFFTGDQTGEIKDVKIPMGERISGWVAYHKKALLWEKPVSRQVRHRQKFDLAELAAASPLRRLGTCLAAPLTTEEGECIGVLSLYAEPEPGYQEDHLRLLKIIAKHVAAAVRNTLLYEETQEHALTDPLTTLPNARYLFLSFEEELNRAANLRIPLTIVELDVDNFKDINDVHGHLVGDKILRGIANAIKTQLRGCDKCVRYAGDEFIVILPGVGQEDVDYVERRLASCIESFSYSPRPGKKIQVKISLGSASFPDEGSNFETLISIADARMYASKYRKKREGQPGFKPKSQKKKTAGTAGTA